MFSLFHGKLRSMNVVRGAQARRTAAMPKLTKLTKQKAKRRQAALQRVIDISERLGLYDAETDELDRLLAKRRRQPGGRGTTPGN